jgi:hypothetical protein
MTHGGFPLVPVFLERVAEVRNTRGKQNSFKILRIEIENFISS